MKRGSRVMVGLAAGMIAVGLGGAALGLHAAEEGAEAVNDIALPTDEASIALGKTRFGEKCGGFCHGSGGKGGRAPCLICGKFKRGGKDSQIAANITNGVEGTAMGAFGGVLSKEEVLAVVAYLRGEQKKKEAESQ
ncbi:MAG: c-type cytochrome [Burkholderiales bacterium]|nr:c-type cytochrome [Burkholderiales bacterium]